MQKYLRLAATAVVIAVLVVIAVHVYGETRATEAQTFDASVHMVQQQTNRMGASVAATHSVVEQDIRDIQALPELVAEWTPRYAEAQDAYRRFDAAIVLAEDQARGYFAAQSALTDRFNDLQQKAAARRQDEADQQLYRVWRQRAHETRDNARRILLRLEDMDTTLRKLELTSEFVFDATRFSDMPAALTDLEGELEQFEEATANIRTITRSPFAE